MRQKDEMERTENARARSNRHILWLTYGIAALFIAMAVYFGWFIQFKSENVIGSSYNARLDLLSDRVTRGSIMSNDKTVLAQTNVASDGSEKRYYPYDYLFVHSVGYSGKNGKTGLESLANFYLLSSHVNLIEKTINEFQGQKNLGDNVIYDARCGSAADGIRRDRKTPGRGDCHGTGYGKDFNDGFPAEF
ncbi:MAG: hypothetical protein ACLR8P_11035 [Clostridium fessum]